jgi:hypothetical protein
MQFLSGWLYLEVASLVGTLDHPAHTLQLQVDHPRPGSERDVTDMHFHLGWLYLVLASLVGALDHPADALGLQVEHPRAGPERDVTDGRVRTGHHAEGAHQSVRREGGGSHPLKKEIVRQFTLPAYVDVCKIDPNLTHPLACHLPHPTLPLVGLHARCSYSVGKCSSDIA